MRERSRAQEAETAPIRLLLLEDDPDDATVVQRALRKAGIRVQGTIVNTEAEFVRELDESPDLIISDHVLPQFNAIKALEHVRKRGDEIPFIIVSGAISEEMAVEAMRQGAADYLLKDRLTRLGESVRQALDQRRIKQEKRDADEAIRLSEERWRRLVEVHPEGLIVTSGGEIVFLNEAALRLMGHDDGHRLLGRSIATLVEHETGVEFSVWLDQVQEKGTLPPEVFRLLRMDGTSKWVEVIAVATTYQGRPAIQSVVRDVSDRRRYELALIQAKERAEEMSNLKSAFLMNMSHEIRTPLTGIIGLSELLAEATTGESIEFAGLIRDSGHRLMETLNSVLDLAALEGKGVVVNLKPTDLHRAAASALELFRPLAQNRGLDLRLENRSIGPVIAQADEAALARVLNNLLSNAVKFTERGHIVVRCGRDGADAYVEVEDTGIGIDPEFMPFLFDEFKQESTGITRTHEGNGLGLSISKRLTELLGGRIVVGSRKGKGSRFIVHLPLDESAAVESEAPAERIVPPTLRVLAVDDQAEALWLLERLLAERCEIRMTHNVEEARATLRSETFDVALIDISLGESFDGVQLAAWCREELPAAPYLVAFTAFALPNDRDRFLELGFDDYLSKPFAKHELMSVLAAGSRAETAAIAPDKETPSRGDASTGSPA